MSALHMAEHFIHKKTFIWAEQKSTISWMTTWRFMKEFGSGVFSVVEEDDCWQVDNLEEMKTSSFLRLAIVFYKQYEGNSQFMTFLIT